jgi:hypothetical protein
MKLCLESEFDSKSRRQVGKQLYHKKKEEVNAAANAKQLTEQGLESWEGANAEQKEARKQTRTDAKAEFVREAAQALYNLEGLAEGIGAVERPKWTEDEKSMLQHKAVELRNAMRSAFGTFWLCLTRRRNTT